MITFWADVTGHYRSTSRGIEMVVVNDADTVDVADADDEEEEKERAEEEN